MSMIVETLEDVRNILPSYNLKSTGSLATRMSDFLARAEEWVTYRIIGEDLRSYILEAIGAPNGDAETIQLTRRVICEHAYITALSELDLQLSEAGFVVQNNERMSPASQQRVAALRESLENRLMDDCDRLVERLISNPADIQEIDDWTGTEQYNYLTQAFIPTISVLRRYSKSVQVTRWEDFHALQPAMHESLMTTVAGYVSEEQVEALLELYRDNELSIAQSSVLRPIRMSIGADIAGNNDIATHFAIAARSRMLKDISDFEYFRASDQYELPGIDFGDGTVANLL